MRYIKQGPMKDGDIECCVIMIKDGVQHAIPFNLDNKDYQEYLKWLEEGNTPEPAAQPE